MLKKDGVQLYNSVVEADWVPGKKLVYKVS